MQTTETVNKLRSCQQQPAKPKQTPKTMHTCKLSSMGMVVLKKWVLLVEPLAQSTILKDLRFETFPALPYQPVICRFHWRLRGLSKYFQVGIYNALLTVPLTGLADVT